ncbi:MAG: hypothetical protein MMC33_005508 [Icmadophila ericetorum]|nr:hypothetical protein [Icmadophila ericetorum]
MASFRPKNKFPLGHNLLDSIDTFSMPTGPYITLLERRRYPNDQTQVQIKIEASVKRRVLEDTIDNEYRSRTIDSKLPLADTSLTSYRVVQFASPAIIGGRALDLHGFGNGGVRGSHPVPTKLTIVQTKMYNREKFITRDLPAHHPFLMQLCIDANNKMLDRTFKEDAFLGYQADRQVEYDGCQDLLSHIADEWIDMGLAASAMRDDMHRHTESKLVDECFHVHSAYRDMEYGKVTTFNHYSGKMEAITKMWRVAHGERIVRREERIALGAAREEEWRKKGKGKKGSTKKSSSKKANRISKPASAPKKISPNPKSKSKPNPQIEQRW